MRFHDPYLYAYMRSFDAPPSYFNTYRRELGLQAAMPKRRPLGRSAVARVPDRPTPEDPNAAYVWVTQKIRNMASLIKPPTKKDRNQWLQETATEVDKARERYENVFLTTQEQRKRSGAARRLQWAQAAHWRALVEAAPEGQDPKTYIRDRMPSLLVVEARLARAADAVLKYRDRSVGRAALREVRHTEGLLVRNREERRELERAYDRAKAKLYRAREAATLAMARRRAEAENYRLPAPAAERAAVKAAEAELRSARQARQRGMAEYRRLMGKLRGMRQKPLDRLSTQEV